MREASRQIERNNLVSSSSLTALFSQFQVGRQHKVNAENCHSTVHHKQGNMSMVEYCRSSGVAMKEAVKRVTSWAAFYHTSRQSWYPKPEGAMLLSQVPFMKPLANVDMRPAHCDALRHWASSYGAAVRQRTVRQETTMARHGTLPEFMHQRQWEVAEQPIYCF